MASAPNFERTTRLVARTLGLTSSELLESFRETTPSEMDDLLRLRELVFGGKPAWDDRRYLEWRYGLAPGTTSHAAFRAVRVRGEMVAGIGAEFFDLITPSGQIKAACAMDILALEQYHGAGLGAWLNLALFQHHPVVLALSSNANSNGMVRSLYTPFQARRELQFPLNADEYVRRRLRVPLLRVLAGSAATFALQLRSRWFQLRAPSPPGTLREILRFAPEQPFVTKRDPQDCSAEIVRNADYLNWRYFDNPRSRYRVLGWCGTDGMLVSYLVFCIGQEFSGTRPLCIVDWWSADDSDRRPFRALVAELTRLAAAQGSHLIRALACGTKLQDQLRAAGFMREVNGDLAAGWHLQSENGVTFAPEEGSLCFTGLGEDMDF